MDYLSINLNIINPEGQQCKLSLGEKLVIFNCFSLTKYNYLKIEENSNFPSKLFIIVDF